MAIVRLGGRTPDVRGMDRQFFGPGAPVRLTGAPLQAKKTVKKSTALTAR
jgi:hypothetical protein